MRSAVSDTALRKANRELADAIGGKSMILVCMSTPFKNCFHRQYTVLREKVAKEEEPGSWILAPDSFFNLTSNPDRNTLPTRSW